MIETLDAPASLIFGRYRPFLLLRDRPIGRVMLAHLAATDTPVVLKAATYVSLLSDPNSAFHRAGEDCFGPGAPDDLVAHETMVLQRLSHPGVPRVLDNGVVDGLPFVVLEPKPGLTLRAALGWGPFAPEEVRLIGVRLLEVLEHAHLRGVVHRDIHPGNILYDRATASVSLIDFALATIDGAGVPGRVGAHAYRAPEAIAFEETDLVCVDHRVDLYALGVVMRELLTGAIQTANDPRGKFDTFDVGDANDGLDAVIGCLTALAPGNRFRDATEARRKLLRQKDPRVAHFDDYRRRRALALGIRQGDEAAPANVVGVLPALILLRESGWLDTALECTQDSHLRAITSVALTLPRMPSLARADALVRLGAFTAARVVAEEVWRNATDDTNPGALALSAMLELRLGRARQALDLALTGITIAPGYAPLIAVQGRALAALGRHEEALGALALACESAPVLGPRALGFIADACLTCGAVGLAVAAALRALEVSRWSVGATIGILGPPDCGRAVLAQVVGQTALLVGERPRDPDLLMPLAVACTHLALADALESEPARGLSGSAKSSVSSPRAARWFARAVEAGRAALTTRAMFPWSFPLTLAVAEWAVGHHDAGDLNSDLAWTLGLADVVSSRPRGPVAHTLLTLAVGGQHSLVTECQRAPGRLSRLFPTRE